MPVTRKCVWKNTRKCLKVEKNDMKLTLDKIKKDFDASQYRTKSTLIGEIKSGFKGYFTSECVSEYISSTMEK